jgi:hypothetical protein
LQRRQHTAPESEPEQLALLRIARRFHVRPVHELAHDRDAIELDETAQLPDESAERLTDVERRRERPRATIRRHERVDRRPIP